MWYDSIFKDQATADEWGPKILEFRQRYFGTETHQTVSKLEVLDFDKLYQENSLQGAVLVPCGQDDGTVVMGGSIGDIKRILFQSSDGNLNFVASCKCGHLRGNYNTGQICPHCKSEVRTAFADEINIHAWLEIPESLPPFLHPVVYRVLGKWMGFTKPRKSSILDCILDVEAELPPLLAGTIGQGMWYFHENFWDIVRYVASTHKGSAKVKDNEEIFTFLEKYKDRLFTRHIPILNQSLHILTHSGTMTYNDDSSQYILKTCIELGNTVYQQRHQPTMSKNYLEQHVYSTYKSWIEYIESVIVDKIISKTGFIRKGNLGARLHHSARGVIVPIIRGHMADEVELPWRIAVGMYKLEIINRLILKYGLDANTAVLYWQQAQAAYSSDMVRTAETEKAERIIADVKDCLHELQAECPFKGLPVIMGRNPRVKVTKNTLVQGIVEVIPRMNAIELQGGLTELTCSQAVETRKVQRLSRKGVGPSGPKR